MQLYTIDENFPKDDHEIYYDDILNQYVLKRDTALNRLALDDDLIEWAKTSNQYERILHEVSDDIYAYIGRYTLPRSRKTKMYLLHKDPDFRDAIKRAMLSQVRYYLRSGAGFIKDQSGVDTIQSRAIALTKLRGDRELSPRAIDDINTHPLALYRGMLRSF